MPIPYTWIYLFHDPFTGLYKIGKSDDPNKRLKELNKSPSTILPTPNNFTFVDAWLAPVQKEGELHRTYAAQRRRGEWFALTATDIEHIGQRMYDYQRQNGMSQIVTDLCQRVRELTNSNAFYAAGLGIFFRKAINQTSNPFIFTKQLKPAPTNDYLFEVANG